MSELELTQNEKPESVLPRRFVMRDKSPLKYGVRQCGKVPPADRIAAYKAGLDEEDPLGSQVCKDPDV